MTQRVTIPISGGTLDPNSLKRLRVALEDVPGVLTVFISQQTEMLYVTFDSTLVDLRILRSAIEQQGFTSARYLSLRQLDRQVRL